MPAIFIDQLFKGLNTKISSPQQWDILANYHIPTHNMKHIDIQWLGINT